MQSRRCLLGLYDKNDINIFESLREGKQQDRKLIIKVCSDYLYLELWRIFDPSNSITFIIRSCIRLDFYWTAFRRYR